ncbi:hypothetical protein HNQ94_000426 [Salirhabdus euzebyi]|uniref:Uncharacterized protein n=1 Tax=Salirhabdus euzebyi TaxID=394506 RepID=A0A841Q1Y2_9BACI|nr:hypothetical protein [Salirhabdus euzebyi]MBB6452005.1 hypothetical protein [Salirhabdus euzebyi]
MSIQKDLQMKNLKIENSRLTELVDQYEKREKIHRKICLGYVLTLMLTILFAIWGLFV